VENIEREPTGRTRGLARFFGWWQRNGRSVLAVFAGAEGFEPTHRPEQPAPPPVVDPRRERFERWGQAVTDFRAGRERAVAAQIADIIPEGVPDDVSAVTQPGLLDVETQVNEMRDWLDAVDPRDFGNPPSPTGAGQSN
jgi:hypothetical protein